MAHVFILLSGGTQLWKEKEKTRKEMNRGGEKEEESVGVKKEMDLLLNQPECRLTESRFNREEQILHRQELRGNSDHMGPTVW